jgi:hypothetical protein
MTTYEMTRPQRLRRRLFAWSLRLSCWLNGEHLDLRPDVEVGRICWACGTEPR